MERKFKYKNLTLPNVPSILKEFFEFFNNGLSNQTPIQLIDGATIVWNIKDGYNSYVTLSTSRILSLTNLTLGDSGVIYITDTVGGNTITLPNGSLVVNSGGGVLTTSATPNVPNIASFYYNQNGVLIWNFSNTYT